MKISLHFFTLFALSACESQFRRVPLTAEESAAARLVTVPEIEYTLPGPIHVTEKVPLLGLEINVVPISESKPKPRPKPRPEKRQHFSVSNNAPICSKENVIETFVPIPHTKFQCTDYNIKCNHCVAILVHLGCDIRNEIELIKDSLINLIKELGESNLYPGDIKLSFVYFGGTHNIQIPLTFLDPINSRFDIRDELNKFIIPDIAPRQRANMTYALTETLRLFNDFKDLEECHTKTLYFITNGHIQCGPCICNDFVCPNWNVTDYECWQSTNHHAFEQIGKLKAEYSDVNVIVATPNARTCDDVLVQKWSVDDQIRNRIPREEMKRYNDKYTEECYNKYNVDVLRNWRYDQLKNDPNLYCNEDMWAERPYEYDAQTSQTLCEMRDNISSNINKPTVEIPFKLDKQNHIADPGLAAHFKEYVESFSDICPLGVPNAESHVCLTDIPTPNPNPKTKSTTVGGLGPRGSSGKRGYTGPPGPGGDPGSTGADGGQGFTGRRGKSGKNAPAMEEKIIVGIKGVPGVEGALGDPGLPGLPGTTGRPGSVGPKGKPGAIGMQGESGCPGTTGKRGRIGPPGASGPEGMQGDTGLSGSGLDEIYFEEYKNTLRELIEDDLSAGRPSPLLKQIGIILATELNKVCRGSDCQPTNQFYPAPTQLNPLCRKPKLAAPGYQSQHNPYLDLTRAPIARQDCPCSHGSERPENQDWHRDRIRIRKPNPMVTIDDRIHLIGE